MEENAQTTLGFRKKNMRDEIASPTKSARNDTQESNLRESKDVRSFIELFFKINPQATLC